MSQPVDFPSFPGRVAVVGSGAVGAYYGGRLASSGLDVSFLVRRDFEIWKEHGLRVRSVQGDFTVHPVRAFRRPEEMGPQDLVVIALKATANEALAQILPPLLHPNTALLTLQNGLGNDDWLAQRFGGQRVFGGLWRTRYFARRGSRRKTCQCIDFGRWNCRNSGGQNGDRLGC